MGINIILPLIIGMALMVSLGSQVVPSFVEQMKVAKVENRTISNQNLIKDAIVRYIKMEKKVPKDDDLEVLEKYGLLRGYHNDNLFGRGYGFTIDKEKGRLKIKTTINDEGATKYFSNSFKFPSPPICTQSGLNHICETFYLLDDDTLASIPPEKGSTKWMEQNFTEEKLGQKLEEGEVLEDGYIDYVKEGDKLKEYIYDESANAGKGGFIASGEEIQIEDGVKYFPRFPTDEEWLLKQFEKSGVTLSTKKINGYDVKSFILYVSPKFPNTNNCLVEYHYNKGSKTSATIKRNAGGDICNLQRMNYSLSSWSTWPHYSACTINFFEDSAQLNYLVENIWNFKNFKNFIGDFNLQPDTYENLNTEFSQNNSKGVSQNWIEDDGHYVWTPKLNGCKIFRERVLEKGIKNVYFRFKY